jgi:imidazolonepropionase-like amidohydrolase
MSFKFLLYSLLLFSIFLIFDSCRITKRSLDTQQNEVYAIKSVNIIPMTTKDSIIENATVVIKDRKIFSINKPIPANAKVVRANNKWLIPGLIDMHVHNLADLSFTANYPTKGATFFIDNQDFMLLYVANGVTTTLELSGRAEHFGQRNEIIKGKVIGPRIALALLIDGGNGGINANTPDDGRQTVRIAKAEGYDFIKVYSHLTIDTYKAIIDEAGKQGMKVVGHIPNAFVGHIEQAFIPNFDMVAHAEEFSKQAVDFSDQEAKHFAQLAKQNGTWLSPTLITMVRIAEQARSLDSVRNLTGFKYVHPLLQSKWLTANNYNNESNAARIAHFQKMADFHVRLVKAFRDAGVPIVTGTDAGTSGVVWGYSLHDEIELLVKAGLTPREALTSATRLPATWLGIDDKVGTIEEGKYADLVLLDANPLDNVSNTRKISGVFVNGRFVSGQKMNAMLADLEKKNNANKGKYEWKKRKEFPY